MEEIKQKTGIIYCRVSTKEQVERTSLESQEKICRDYADRNCISIVKVFVDKGESAKTADRTEFKKAITLCTDKKTKIDYFIVYKVDRFSRNQEDHVVVKATLKRCGTQLVSATEPIDESPIGKAMEGVLSVFAEFDNNVRAERSKNGMIEQVKKGLWVWKPPIGYKRSGVGLSICIDPEPAKYIKLMFEEYEKGTYTYRGLTRFITDRGFKTTTGKEPCFQLVEKILKNPIYCGIIRGFGMEIRGSFEPIVCEKTFYECQKEFKRSSGGVKYSKHLDEFALKGVVCGHCNTSITASSSTGRAGKKYPYYHHYKPGCVKARSIPKETFEQLFIEYLSEITPKPMFEKIFKAIVLDIWKENYRKFDKESSVIRSSLEKLEQDRQHIFEMHRKGVYSDQEFVEQKDLINRTIQEKNRLLQDYQGESFEMNEVLNHCFNFVRNTTKWWVKAGYKDRIRFQNMVLKEKPKFNGERFGNTKLSLVYKLNQESNGEKTNLVVPTGFEPVFTH